MGTSEPFRTTQVSGQGALLHAIGLELYGNSVAYFEPTMSFVQHLTNSSGIFHQRHSC